jgi:uncharacterized protein involved in outer membrane biogenesis
MRRFLRWFVGALLCLLALALVVWLCQDALLRSYVERRIRAQTGLEARLGRLKLGFGSARLTVQGFRLMNRPEFGGQPLLDMPELHVALDTDAAGAGKLRFKEIRLYLAEFNVVRDRAGRLNIESLAQTTRAGLATNAAPRPPSARGGYEFGGIDRLTLSLGRLTYTDLRQPASNTAITLGVENEVVTDLRTEEDLNRWLATLALRMVVQEYLRDPGRSRTRLLELLFSGARRD